MRTLRDTLADVLWRPRALVWLGLLTAFGLAVGFRPPYDVVDLDLSWILALLVGPAAAHVAMGGARRLQARLGHQPGGVAVLPAAWLTGLVLLAPPVLAIALHGLRSPLCAPLAGARFLALDAAATALLGATLGTLLGLAVARRWLGGLLLVLVLAGAVGLAAWRLVAQPPVVVFGHWVGFFPGSIYDFAQPLPPRLLWLRALTLAWLGLGGLAVWSLRRGGLTRAAVAAAALLLFLLELGPLDVNADRATIQAALGGHRRTAHFDLYFGRRLTEAQQDLLARDHEYQHARLTRLLGRAPAGRLASYVYPTPRGRRRLLGAARTSVARPWSGEMHLIQSRYPHPQLAHELAHLFSRELGDRTTGLSGPAGLLPNLGLIEGLAVAAAWDEPEYTPHEWSAALRRLQLAPPVHHLFQLHRFWSAVPATAYLSSGSFVAHLWERHGLTPFAAAYPRGDLAAAYTTPLPELIRGYEAFLDTVPVSEDLLARARFRFTRPTLFQRRCARAVALLSERAGRALRQARPAEACALLDEARALDPDRPTLLVLAGRAALRAGDPAAARALATPVVTHPGSSGPLAAAARELLGDAAWLAGQPDVADREWRAGNEAPTSAVRTRRCAIKRALARAGAGALIRYLLGVPRPEAEGLLDAAAADRGSVAPLAHYLRGLWRLARARLAEAAADLERAGGLDDVAPEVERNRVLALADALLMDGEAEGAEVLYRQLAGHERRAGARAALADRIARCRWEQARTAASDQDPFAELRHPLIPRAEDPAPLDLAGLAPDGWDDFQVAGPDEHYHHGTLYDYLDGAAELYLQHDFHRLAVRRYRSAAGAELTLEVFELASPEDARAVARRGERTTGPGLIAFAAEQFFVTLHLHPADATAQTSLAMLASLLDSRIGSSASPLHGTTP